MIGITLFQSAYTAEAVRGGLQAIDKGQTEASMAFGLGYWEKCFHYIASSIKNFYTLNS